MVRSVSAESDCGGSTQELSPECTPASSMCSMMPAMRTSVPSPSAYIDFGGVVQEAVHQHGAVLREGHRLAHVLAHHFLVVGDDHGAAAQHIAGTHQHRIADARGYGAGFLHAGGG